MKAENRTYRVSNSADGTELYTNNRESAIRRLLSMQFPGVVVNQRTGAVLDDIDGYELDAEGYLTRK